MPRPKANIDLEVLRRMYEHEGRRVTEIARTTGLGVSTVYKYLKRDGISRQRVIAPKHQGLRRMYEEEGRSVKQIASLLNRHYSTILYHMEREGIPRRARVRIAAPKRLGPNWKPTRRCNCPPERILRTMATTRCLREIGEETGVSLWTARRWCKMYGIEWKRCAGGAPCHRSRCIHQARSVSLARFRRIAESNARIERLMALSGRMR